MVSKRSLQSWLTYLEAIHPLSMDFKLARIISVYERLNIAPVAPLVITVAGTNGKGSTSTTIANLFHAQGKRVGLFTSPHLYRFNERIRIDLEEVTDEQLIDAFEKIDQARGDITLTYFEFATLAAFIIFKSEKVDVAVLEVGLGGRLDATNIIDANIAVITPIGIDHTALLGNTIDEIAGEKAGIIKTQSQVILAENTPSHVLIEKALAKNAPVYINGQHFRYRTLDDATFLYQFGDSPDIALPQPNLLGLHQYQNAATAITTLYLAGIDIDDSKIADGLKSVQLDGRFQSLTRANSPTVYLDVTHNAQGAGVLKAIISKIRCEKPNSKIIALLGMLKDKDASALTNVLSQSFDRWILAPINDDERGQSAESLAEKIAPQLSTPFTKATSIEDGCQLALESANTHDIIIVFGSFHMMANSLNWFKENRYV